MLFCPIWGLFSDFKCTWCDTPNAVLPHRIKDYATKMDEQEIYDALEELPAGPEWVILSGGNPVLHGLQRLIYKLQNEGGYSVAVETQGSKEKFWLYDVDRLCLSPKPPSSGQKFNQGMLGKIIYKCHPERTFFKVVVFDDRDYDFARNLHMQYPDMPMFLSAGNDAGSTVGNPLRVDGRPIEQVQVDLLKQAKWLTTKMMADTEMSDVRVQAQFHVLIWGNIYGV